MGFTVPHRALSLLLGAGLLVALVAGCAKISSGGPAGTIITNGPGNNTTDESGDGFVGSCIGQVNGATVACVDMYFDANPSADCQGTLYGTFSSSHCNQSGAVGECQLSASPAQYDLYYYSPYTPSTARAECANVSIPGATATFQPIGSQQATSVAGIWTGACLPEASGIPANRRTFYFDFNSGSATQGDYAVETDFYQDNSCTNLIGYAQAYGNFIVGQSVSISSPSGTVSGSLFDLTQTGSQYIANTSSQNQEICDESVPPSTYGVSNPTQCPGVTTGELQSGATVPDVIYFPPQGGLVFANSNVYGNPPASGPGSSDASPYTSLEQSAGSLVVYSGP